MKAHVRADPMQMIPPVVISPAQTRGGKAGMEEQAPPETLKAVFIPCKWKKT